jgi:hypothetical protein
MDLSRGLGDVYKRQLPKLAMLQLNLLPQTHFLH